MRIEQLRGVRSSCEREKKVLIYAFACSSIRWSTKSTQSFSITIMTVFCCAAEGWALAAARAPLKTLPLLSTYAAPPLSYSAEIYSEDSLFEEVEHCKSKGSPENYTMNYLPLKLSVVVTQPSRNCW
jgi:hypothetical protein